jgi:hypothetical protein
VVIDSYFAERGRLGRVLGAAAQNPTSLGLMKARINTGTRKRLNGKKGTTPLPFLPFQRCSM